MKTRILALVMAIPIGVAVTVVLLVASAFAGGVCHCDTPISIFFPFGTFITMRTSWETTGLFATLLQFPFYATIIALPNAARSRLLVSFFVLIIHSVAAAGAVTMYRWW
jgi:hypothetical protein